MSDTIAELHDKAQHYAEKYNDSELTDYLLSLATKLEQAETVRHHFGYFVMHAQAVLPYEVRPRHFRDALERAKRVLAES